MIQNFFVRREIRGVPYYSCLALEESPHVRHGFSTRQGGVSPLPQADLNLSYVSWDAPERVGENRRRFLSALDLSATRLVTLAQIHSDRLHIIEETPSQRNRRLEGDALATVRPGTALAVQVADCFPILLADGRANAVAAIHAGWRGILARVLTKTVAALRASLGTDPGNLRVAIGPAIRRCCFEVGEDVVAQFRAAYPRVELAEPRAGCPGKHLLDLRRALDIQCAEAGIPPGNIFDLQACTRCNPGEFFSYRAEGAHSGRMMGVIARV